MLVLVGTVIENIWATRKKVPIDALVIGILDFYALESGRDDD